MGCRALGEEIEGTHGQKNQRPLAMHTFDFEFFFYF